MIQKLRLKFSLLVLAGLLVVTGGVVFSINYTNYSRFHRQVESSLQILADSGGQRPSLLNRAAQPRTERGKKPGQPNNGPGSAADLSTFYTVQLDGNGSILRWSSDRADLYTDQQIQELVDYVLATESNTGCLGSQYYKLTEQPGWQLLVVLDARLEQQNARKLLLTSSLTGLVAYVLMGLGAVLLIQRMTRPAQEAFDRQKQFVMDASHELKTPLSVISANAEALYGEIGENQWLHYIQSEVRRTDQLVRNLLTMARLDRSAVQARRQSFDLSRAVLSVALPFEGPAFEEGKTLLLDVPEGVVYNGNEEMCKQLTVILLSNAMKYSDTGGVVSVSLRSKGDRRILRVHNTGAGISTEDLPWIFDRFYRADRARSREREGYGLGLSIAKAIVEAHRGKITAESCSGQWACFTVTL